MRMIGFRDCILNDILYVIVRFLTNTKNSTFDLNCFIL